MVHSGYTNNSNTDSKSQTPTAWFLLSWFSPNYPFFAVTETHAHSLWKSLQYFPSHSQFKKLGIFIIKYSSNYKPNIYFQKHSQLLVNNGMWNLGFPKVRLTYYTLLRVLKAFLLGLTHRVACFKPYPYVNEK